MKNTATAHLDWDNRWRSDEGRAEWLEPDRHVRDAARLLKARGARTVLDLGCGVGRHALFLAQSGFAVRASDASAAGVAHCRQEAERLGLRLELAVAMMSEQPYADATFDYVLAFNVIYHGDPRVVAAAVSEIRRVLRPGGLFQGTLLSKRNANFGHGREVASDTFVVPDATDDKTHPHFYCDAGDVVRVLHGFELLHLSDEEQKRPGHWHWQFLAERL